MSNPVHFYSKSDPFFELSNYFVHKTPLEFNDKKYKTAEHLFQAMKFMSPEANPATLAYAETIRTAKTPNIAKILARQKIGGGYPWRTALNPIIKQSLSDGVKIRDDWESVRLKIMKLILLLKFRQDNNCRTVLLSTGDRDISEHTSADLFWGDGGDAKKGEDHLGYLLMQMRDKLRSEKRVKR